jgi:type I thyroxine 5'-deiodinase
VYKDRAEFLTVYINEAHPEDEWQMDSNVEDEVVFKQPTTFPERQELAKVLVERLKYRLPVAVDGMDNAADKAYAAWPERIYVIARGGRIVYKGGMGPFGFKPDQAEKKLAAHLAAVTPKPATDRSLPP